MDDSKVEIDKRTFDFYMAEVKAMHRLLDALGAPRALPTAPNEPVVGLTPSQRLQKYIDRLTELAEHGRSDVTH